MVRSAFVLALLLTIAGCHRSRAPVVGPASDNERYAVLALTENEWPCAPDATRVERAGPGRFVLMGCDVTHAYVCGSVLNVPQCFNDDEGKYAPGVP